jgi:hypothetical protein
MREDGMRIQDTNKILQESRDLRHGNPENQMSWTERMTNRVLGYVSQMSHSIRHNRTLQAGLISVATAATAGVVANRMSSRRRRWFD